MLSIIFPYAIVMAVSVSALPASVPYFWGSSSPKSTFIDFVGKRGEQVGSTSVCDLSQASLPTAPTPLPTPDSSLALSHVAIGRGTQNYTCDLSNSTATPVAVGAVASLYNVSCIAASMPSLLEHIPAIALDLPTPSSDDSTNPSNADLSGHHYFINTTTPFFNLDTSSHSYGTGAFKKISSSNAPSDAVKGQNNEGNGAVTWLKLTAQDPSGQPLQEVYRVNTAGGMQPKTCSGMAASFEVQYAAEYWIYEKA